MWTAGTVLPVLPIPGLGESIFREDLFYTIGPWILVAEHDQGGLAPRLEAFDGLDHVRGDGVVLVEGHQEGPLGGAAPVPPVGEGGVVGICHLLGEPEHIPEAVLKRRYRVTQVVWHKVLWT